MSRGVRARRCGTLLLAVVLAGGAGGCGTGGGAGPGAPPAPGGQASTGSGSASGTATADPRPAETLVEVVVTGGFAGVRNRLVVRQNGDWTVESGTGRPRTGRQTRAETAELRTALADPAYALVPPRPTGQPIADGFRYEVTYRHRVVVADDGDRPPALRRVFAALPEGGPPTGP